jgi:hypothetical protein
MIKKLLFSIFFTLALLGCSKGQNELTSSNPVGVIDSISELFNLESNIEPAEKIVEETFLGFFNNFMWDRDFQRSHVFFPIKKNGVAIRDSSDWVHLPFYTIKPFMPILLLDSSDHPKISYKKGSTLVSILSFKANEATKYTFQRDSLSWDLTSIQTSDLYAVPDSKFIKFLINFSSDSLYQKSHIKFPLSYDYADADKDFETINSTITMNDWRFIDFGKNIEGLFYPNVISTDPCRKIFLQGIENGIHVRYTFCQKNKVWNLVRLEDYST